MSFYASPTSGGRPLMSVAFTLLQMTEKKLVVHTDASQCFIFRAINEHFSLHIGLQTFLSQ